VKDVGFHKQLLSDKFKCADGFTLNIKESAQEQNKRKLFFGRLSDEITKEKMIDMIEMVRSGSKNEIEGELTSGYTPRNNYTGSFIPYFRGISSSTDKKAGKK